MTKGYTQEGLALEASLDRSFISRMERGLTQPTLTTLIYLSDILDIAPSDLIVDFEKEFLKNKKKRKALRK